MKRLFLVATIALTAFPLQSFADADVSLSVRVGEPGFYGAIDIGNAPPPVVYSPQPMIVQPVPAAVAPLPPLYLRVPAEHRAHWKRHCAEYNACGRPVYFVNDKWYKESYAPHYQKHEGYYRDRREFNERQEREWRERGPGRGEGRGQGRGREGRD